MDRSLKSKAALTRHRNVLSRAERIKRLTDEERWGDERSIFGLPKVAHRKANVGAKKKKEKKAEGEAGAEAVPGAAVAAAPAAAAPAGKAAGKGAGKGAPKK